MGKGRIRFSLSAVIIEEGGGVPYSRVPRSSEYLTWLDEFYSAKRQSVSVFGRNMKYCKVLLMSSMLREGNLSHLASANTLQSLPYWWGVKLAHFICIRIRSAGLLLTPKSCQVFKARCTSTLGNCLTHL